MEEIDPLEPHEIDAIRARYLDEGGILDSTDIPVLLWGLMRALEELNRNMELFMEMAAQDPN